MNGWSWAALIVLALLLTSPYARLQRRLSVRASRKAHPSVPSRRAGADLRLVDDRPPAATGRSLALTRRERSFRRAARAQAMSPFRKDDR
jgi:hypothetical protein